jgi:predicted nucleic acid-binding protein
MTVFVDTSALLAVLNAADDCHTEASREWERLLNERASLFCTDYVLVEVLALIQSRLGMRAVQLFREDILPVLTIRWVDPRLFDLGLAALVVAGKRGLSLVDCVSFETMRLMGLRSAFAFDKHFREAGFDCLPKRKG